VIYTNNGQIHQMHQGPIKHFKHSQAQQVSCHRLCYLDLQPPSTGSSHCGQPGTLKTGVRPKQTDLAYHLKKARHAMIKVLFVHKYKYITQAHEQGEIISV